MRWLLWRVPVLSCGASPQDLSFALVREFHEHPTRIYTHLRTSTLAAIAHKVALVGYPRSTTLTTGAGNLSGNLGVGGRVRPATSRRRCAESRSPASRLRTSTPSYRWLLAHGSTGSGRSDRKGKPLAAKTVKQVHSLIRLALAQGKKWRWVTSNVALDASPPAAHQRQAAPPTSEAVLALLSLIDAIDPEFSLFLRLAATAGPRRGEMCALRWSAADLERGTLRVLGRIVWNKSEHQWEERQSTKTGKDRRLVLGPRTLELLRAHRERMSRRAEESGIALSPDALVFSDEPDCSKAWSPQRMTRTFAAYRNQAGLPAAFRLHDLRAFLSTRLQEAGHPLPIVSGRLGHSQVLDDLGPLHGLDASG